MHPNDHPASPTKLPAHATTVIIYPHGRGAVDDRDAVEGGYVVYYHNCEVVLAQRGFIVFRAHLTEYTFNDVAYTVVSPAPR